MLTRIAMAACILVVTGCSPTIYKPGTFRLRSGTVFLVDDGKCPKGQVTKLTGPGWKRSSSKTRECVIIPQ